MREKNDTKRHARRLTRQKTKSKVSGGQSSTRHNSSGHHRATSDLATRLNAERLRLRLTWPEYSELFKGEAGQATLWKLAHRQQKRPHELTVVVVSDVLGSVELLKSSAQKGAEAVQDYLQQLARLARRGKSGK